MRATLESRFNKNINESSEEMTDASLKPPSMLCVPVFGGDGNVISIIQALNKKQTAENNDHLENRPRFSSTDAWNLQAMAIYLSFVVNGFFHREGVKGPADSRSAKDVLKIAREYSV